MELFSIKIRCTFQLVSTDNDLAGQKTVETIAGMYGRCVYNESNCYAGYKDLNDYLRGKKQ